MWPPPPPSGSNPTVCPPPRGSVPPMWPSSLGDPTLKCGTPGGSMATLWDRLKILIQLAASFKRTVSEKWLYGGTMLPKAYKDCGSALA